MYSGYFQLIINDIVIAHWTLLIIFAGMFTLVANLRLSNIRTADMFDLGILIKQNKIT